MPKKANLEPKTTRISVPQKNGSVYIYERITQYDPEKKYNRVLHSRLIGKIPQGETDIVPTRGKKSSSGSTSGRIRSASAKRVGVTDILDWIGKESGIDQDLYNATDKATASKIISLARYWVSNPGRTIPYFEEWQINHCIPYEPGMSEDVCYDLMKSVGLDAELMQKFFFARARRTPSKASVAFDSTTVSSYSENQIEARYGYNKSGDGLKTVKLLTQYCVETGQPVAYSRQPGDIPDVVSVSNACEQLAVLGMAKPLLVMDAGFYSESNICTLLRKHVKFLIRGDISVKWVKEELDKVLPDMEQLSNTCPFETGTYGVMVPVKHVFSWNRKRGRGEASKGDTVQEEHRIYLYFYRNKAKADLEAAELADEIRKVADRKKTDTQQLSAAEESLARKYLIIRNTRGGLSVTYNDEAFREAIRYAGCFVLITASPIDTFDTLQKFRQREKVEEFYRLDKQNFDGNRTRVWYPDSLNGRFFCQFVALCYHEYLRKAIKDMKKKLAIPNGDHVHDLKENMKAEKKLLDWLDKMSISRLFSWFDCIEATAVDTSMGRRRWQTESTSRDQLFLAKLGVISK